MNKTKDYDLWVDGHNKLLVQQGEKITVLDVSSGIFSVTNDEKGHFVIYSSYHYTSDIIDVNVIETDNEDDAAKAITRIKRELKKRHYRDRWILFAVYATCIFIAGLTSIAIKNEIDRPAKQSPAHQIQVDQAQKTDNPPIPAPPITTEKPAAPAPVAIVPSGFIDPATLPLATKWSYGNPKGIPLYVFSDPQCQHCKKLEKVLNELKADYFLHVYPTPRLGDDSTALIAQFACDADPRKAWSDWMSVDQLNNKVDMRKDCTSAAIAAAEVNKNFLNGHNLRAVPVLIRQDGAVHLGDMDKASLLQWLANKEVKQEAQSSCN